jgi:hypothetical protein
VVDNTEVGRALLAGKSPSHEVAVGFLQSRITANNREFGLRCPNGPFCRESLPYPSISFGSMGIVQADVFLARDSWRLVEAVTGATSADDLSERLRALISE